MCTGASAAERPWRVRGNLAVARLWITEVGLRTHATPLPPLSPAPRPFPPPPPRPTRAPPRPTCKRQRRGRVNTEGGKSGALSGRAGPAGRRRLARRAATSACFASAVRAMKHPGRSAGALDSFKRQRLSFLFCSGALTVIRIPRGRVAQSHRANNNSRAVAEAVARINRCHLQARITIVPSAQTSCMHVGQDVGSRRGR